MKKILLLVLIVVFACLGLSCNNKTDYLELDEFAVYEDGRAVELPTLEEDYYYFSDLLDGGLQGAVLETKRGIRIGSSLEEVAEAYDGEFFVGETYYAGFKDYTNFKVYLKDYATPVNANNSRKNAGKLQSASFYTYDYHGDIIGEKAIRRRIKMIGGKSLNWPGLHTLPYKDTEITQFGLVFYFEDERVKYIMIENGNLGYHN